LAYTLGVKQLIVCINKMDDKSVNFSERRYRKIKVELSTFLTKCGYKPAEMDFVPVSGWRGDNLVTRYATLSPGCPALVCAAAG
jgi:elongation factor 1-alpha